MVAVYACLLSFEGITELSFSANMINSSFSVRG